jgi:hypothetical protein
MMVMPVPTDNKAPLCACHLSQRKAFADWVVGFL